MDKREILQCFDSDLGGASPDCDKAQGFRGCEKMAMDEVLASLKVGKEVTQISVTLCCDGRTPDGECGAEYQAVTKNSEGHIIGIRTEKVRELQASADKEQ